MKSLNGLVFIVLGALAIWIGATGRLPALAAALGIIRNKPTGTGGAGAATGTATVPNFSDVSSGSSSTTASAQAGAFVTPKGQSIIQEVTQANAAFFKAVGLTNE